MGNKVWAAFQAYFVFLSSHIACLVQVPNFTTISHYPHSVGQLVSKMKREEMKKRTETQKMQHFPLVEPEVILQVALKSLLRKRNKERLAKSPQLTSVFKHQEHMFWNPTNLDLRSGSVFY